MKLKYILGVFIVFSTVWCGMINGQCAGPESIIVDRLQANNATFKWQPSQAATYILEIGRAGVVPGSGTRTNTMDTIVSVRPLNQKTEYDVYLYSSCANGDKDTISLAIETLYQVDIGVTMLDAPTTACDLTSLEDITLSITNFGQQPQQLFDFGYSLEDVEGNVSRPFDGFYTGIVGFDSTVMTTFDVQADLAIPGEYEFKIWTALPDDSDNGNDTFTVIVTHQPVIDIFPYEWDFELWKGGWLIDESQSTNSSLEFGRPNSTTIPAAASGKQAWATNLFGDYNANEKSVLISPCFDFSDMTNDPYMSFALNYEGEACCDFAIAEISINDGRNWTKIGDGENGINWYNNNDDNQWDGDGVTQGWSRVQNRLFGAAGRDSVRIRYIFQSDGSNQGSGLAIDDIHIYEPYGIDAAIAVIDHQTDIECGLAMDSVVVAVENTGLSDISSFIISYSLNEGSAITETINRTLVAEQRDTFVLSTAINTASDGAYNLTAWVAAPGDGYSDNDTLFTDFIIEGQKPLPLIEDFEGSDFPEGWESDAMNIGIDHGSTTSIYYAQLSGSNSTFELTSPNVGPIAAMDELIFDYRIVNDATTATTLGASDKLEIQISEDCGVSYMTVMTIDQSNHTSTTSLANIQIDLSAYAGKDIKVRFIGTRGQGAFFVDLDNINVTGCPVDLGLSIDQVAASSGSASDGTLTVSATNGVAPYMYAWSNSMTNASISGIAAGNYTVSVTDANGCTDMISIDLEACTDLGLTVNTTRESSVGNDGTAMVMANTGSGPYTYQWNTGVSTDMLFDLSMGTYQVTVTDANGCSAMAEAIIDVETSIPNIPSLERFAVYPNPTDGLVKVDFELTESKDAVMHLFNGYGQLINTGSSIGARVHQFDIDTSIFPDGIYFIRISIDGNAITKRLLVQH